MKAVLPLFQNGLPETDQGLASVETDVSPLVQSETLWLALHFLELPLVVFEAVDAPLVVVESSGQPQVIAANAAARETGIEAGLSLSAAYALSGGLRVQARDAVREQALLERLACWALQFSSQVSLSEGQGFLIEVGHSLRLFGGLSGLREHLDDALERLGFRVSHAMAPTPSAAWAMARIPLKSMAIVTNPEALRASLGPYPIECLALDEKRQNRLLGMGVQRLSDLWRLPRAGVAKRFGKAFVHQCRQLLGEAPEPREFHAPPPKYEGALPLIQESRDSERLLLGIGRLLEEMRGLLHAYDAGVRQVEIGLWHQQGPATRFSVGKSRPSREPEQWLRVIRERFERLQLPEPVCEVGLRAHEFESLSPVSQDLFSRANEDQEPIEQLIERLQARLGTDCVRGICNVADHRPEKAMRWCQPGEYTDHELPEHAPKRPLWLLPEPRYLSDPGSIQLLSGPERIETGWWDGHDVCRDYWIARDAQSSRCWIFQDRRSKQWYLHGLFA